MLVCDSYAEGTSWYGCGLDIEDNGGSFGHTGAMDGTTSTVHCDVSGLTWCLLLNAWAQDVDLDGVVKFALTTVPGQPFWQEVPLPPRPHQCVLYSRDRSQCVAVLVPHHALHGLLAEMRGQYIPTHVSALSNKHEVLFTIIFIQCSSTNEWSFEMDIPQEVIESSLQTCMKKGTVLVFEVYLLHGKVNFVIIVKHGPVVHQQHGYVVGSLENHKRNWSDLARQHFTLQTLSILDQGGLYCIACLLEQVGCNEIMCASQFI